MGDTGMGEVAQFLSIGVQGAKFGFDVSKDALHVIWKFVTWAFNLAKAQEQKKGGWKFKQSIIERSEGDVQFFKIPKNGAASKKFKKDLKKNMVPYSIMPSLKNSKDKEHEYIMYCTCDAPRFNHCAEALVEHYKGKENECGNVSFEEMTDGTGMKDVTLEEFNVEMRKVFGSDYKTFEEIGEIKKNEDSLEVAEKLDKLANYAIFKDKITQENSVKFKHTFSEEDVLKQTDDYFMLRLDKDSKMGVWLPKNSAWPTFDGKSFSNKDRLFVLPKDAELVVESINPEDKHYLKAYAEEFSKKINNNYYDEMLTPASLDMSLLKKESSNGIVCRVPGYYGDNEAHIELPKDSYKILNNDKTIVTKFDPNRNYELMFLNGKKEKVSGRELLKNFSEVSDNIKNVAKTIEPSKIVGSFNNIKK